MFCRATASAIASSHAGQEHDAAQDTVGAATGKGKLDGVCRLPECDAQHREQIGTGRKHPRGASLKLLVLVEKGLEAVA